VTVLTRIQPGENVRRPGRDVAAGNMVAKTGTVVNPACIGVLAGQGLASVRAVPRPRVGVLSTGAELFSGMKPLPPGHVRDANRPTLLALVAREGWDCIDLGSVPDDEGILVQVLHDAAPRCDAILTSGGLTIVRTPAQSRGSASHTDDDGCTRIIAKKRQAATATP
jgi:molybdopterin molybdotransferase